MLFPDVEEMLPNIVVGQMLLPIVYNLMLVPDVEKMLLKSWLKTCLSLLLSILGLRIA